ncbi:amidase family protein [Aspergillus undulatus]|uniref:amidase family protein n=1 Tax=Aspergillus undulatus TaxID=1810928 RepID=UPI003CCCE60B
MAAFAMSEETVFSGRSPASNNGLVAYTPSRGILSIRGNWPLSPVADVVVPYARTVADLLSILDVIVADDQYTTLDFWRGQPFVSLSAASSMRPPRMNPAPCRNKTRLSGMNGEVIEVSGTVDFSLSGGLESIEVFVDGVEVRPVHVDVNNEVWSIAARAMSCDDCYCCDGAE